MGVTLLRHLYISNAAPNPCKPSCDLALYTAVVLLLAGIGMDVMRPRVHDGSVAVFLTARVCVCFCVVPGSRHKHDRQVLITALDGLATKRALACELLQEARSPTDQSRSIASLNRVNTSARETAAQRYQTLYRRATIMGSTVEQSVCGSEGISEQTPSAACCPTRRLARDGK